MPEISKVERLLNLAALFLRERRPVPLETVLAEVDGFRGGGAFEALERRFLRDLDDLAELGLRVDFVADDGWGARGYRLRREDSLLPRLALSREESFVLALLAAQRQQLPAPLREQVALALAKLQFDHPLDDVPATPSDDAPRADAPPEALAAVLRALAEARPLAFVYRGARADRARPRTVEPYGLGSRRGAWYLVGRDREAGEVRTFHLARIEGEPAVTEDGPPVEVPADFDLAAALDRRPWTFGVQTQRAVLSVAPELAWLVERALDPDVERRPGADGRVRFAFAASDEAALVRFVLGFQGRVRLEEPAAAAAALDAMLDRLAARYAGDAP